MKQKIMPKGELGRFLEKLIEKYEVIAPVKSGNTKFKKINSADEVYLEKVTLVPFKKFFIGDGEELFSFEKGKIKVEGKRSIKKRVIFGLRKCDLNAIERLDNVMYDKLYKDKRKNTILIGMHCDNPDEFCFCDSMELDDGKYDLFFYLQGGKYYISVGSKKGGELVRGLKNSEKEVILKIKNSKALNRKDIEKYYRGDTFEEDVDKCLSCSACTVNCPTCNCFDIKDELEMDFDSGKRIRRPASCMLKSFSRVAGGKVFRESRESRFKHFVFHKIVYYKNKYGKYMCVGCGRCLRSCPTKIDWVATINKIKEERN